MFVKRILLGLLLIPLHHHAQQITATESPPLRNDSKRVELSSFTNIDPDKFGSAVSYEVVIGLKFKEVWFDTFFASSTGNFDAVGFNSSAKESNHSEGFFERTEETTFNLFQSGMGLGLESALFNELLGTTNFYEYSTGFLTYTIFEDSLREGERYGGLGLRADYSLNYRYAGSSHLFLRFSYRFSPVKRSAKIAGESGDERTLMLSWPSVGMGFSYFF